MALHNRRRHIWPLLLALSVACIPTPSWSAATSKAKKTTRSSGAARPVAKAEPPAPRPATPVHACVDDHGRNHYSQFPCAEGGNGPLQWRDDRNAQQLKEAQQMAQREQRLAQAIARDRQRDERMAEKERAPSGRARGAKRQTHKEKSAARPDRSANKNFRAKAPAQPTIQGANSL